MKKFFLNMFSSQAEDVSLMRVMVFLICTAVLGNWSLYCWVHLWTDQLMPQLSVDALIAVLGALSIKWGQKALGDPSVKNTKEAGIPAP